MSNIDFISEKWRTCRRTRNLAYINVASSIFPIIYVAVYAEAQRRDGDDKELGAALAALMFNVFQLMRTITGILQLNAFVAWCKDGVPCMRALLGKGSENRKRHVDLDGLSQFKRIVAWSKRRAGRMSALVCRRNEHNEQTRSRNHHGKDIVGVIEVNNTVVDNELGGKEVTVLPSWRKIWGGLKKGSFVPSRWISTDRVMLNTVRWSAAFLCGMEGFGGDAEILKKFFSEEMYKVRHILQFVDWNVGVENGSPEILSICAVGDIDENVELTGEMSTAYGTGSYSPMGTGHVKSYSFEFNGLVSSYPFRVNKRNRNRVTVELAHSVIEKLKAIRRYYDGHHVPAGRIRRDAFKTLLAQTNSSIPDDDTRVRMLFDAEFPFSQIPLFPYRMQAVALCDEATNWRVLQASAQFDIWISLMLGVSKEQILHDGPHEIDILDYCAR